MNALNSIHSLKRTFFVCLGLAVVTQLSPWAAAQSGTTQQQNSTSSFQPFAAQTPKEMDPWKFEGRLHLEKDSNEGYIVLQVDLKPDHYIYSVTPNGSPAPTEISLIPNASVMAQGTFSPNVKPSVVENDPIFNRRIEKHKDRVQFFIPCKIDANADFESAGMPVIEFNGQVCSAGGLCIPVRKERVAVNFAGYFERNAQSASQTASPNGSSSKATAPRR